MTSIDIFITLGHRATLKSKPTDDGFTHDWQVYVKGDDGNAIENFIDKVVFNLHASFPKPKRVCKELPFEVRESGYAGFLLPINIYFKNKEEPKKIAFEYDMFLRLDGSVSNTRREKLTFTNPSDDFKKLLIKAGGIVHDNKSNGNNSTSESIPRNRLSNNLSINNQTSSNNTSNNGLASNQLSTIRKHVIPSKDKSQQQHLSAKANNSPNNQHKKDEFKDKSTKDKQSKFQEYDDFNIFGTPIQARNAKETNLIAKDNLSKIKNSKSSSDNKSNNSRSSTPTSLISKEISKKERRKDKEINRLDKSNSSNSSSNSHSRSLLASSKDSRSLSKSIKRENDPQYDTSTSRTSSSKFQDQHERNNHFYKANLKSNLSSSSSSLNSIDDNNNKTKSVSAKSKKRKNRSDSVSSEHSFNSSNDSGDESSSSSSVRSYSNRSLASSIASSNLSSINKKKSNEIKQSPSRKKIKKEKGSKNSSLLLNPNVNIKKEANISASRPLSSSLSSINSDYKTKDDLKKKSNKDKSGEKNHDKSSKDKSKKDEEKSRKEHKKKRKEGEESSAKDKSSKKQKSPEEKASKKHKTSSNEEKTSKELCSQQIIKEKNKDLMNKQTAHKEHNLKKEATTSTKISYTNNNNTGLTTLEITSVKNVKMLQSESKKSKQHQDQSLNQSDKRSFKTDKQDKQIRQAKNYYLSPLNGGNDNFNNSESPSMNDKFANYNSTKDSYLGKQKVNSDYREMNKNEISPLNSSLNSEDDELNFDYTNEYSNDEMAFKKENGNLDEEDDEFSNLEMKDKKHKLDTYLDDDDEYEHRAELEYVNDLILLQKQITELKDKDLLNEIVSIIKESGRYNIHGTAFDFDLLKLDKTTVKKVKLCFL